MGGKKKWVWVWPHQEVVEEEVLSPVNSDNALNSRGLSNMSGEQIARDQKITRLLEAYVRSYEKKSAQSAVCRFLILSSCTFVVCGCAYVLARVCTTVFSAEEGPDLEQLAAFVTACVALPVSIINVLHIITEYFFSKEDEKYITDIVKLVQTNDLENRKESARIQQENPPAPSRPPDCDEESDGLPEKEGSPPISDNDL